jgi:hypothetical protein
LVDAVRDAEFHTAVKVIDMFDEKARYDTK